MVKFEPSVTLPNGDKMPMVGLGTWQSKPNEVRDAVAYALDIGYRHIDTAYIYGNEKEIGEALAEKFREGKIKREDVFITTKLWSTHMHPDRVMDGVNKSLSDLGVDYVDLYLAHNPVPMKMDSNGGTLKDDKGSIQYDSITYLDTWKVMEKAVDQGLVRSIGLSNFNKRQIQNILDHARIKPANLQVECHAYFMQKPLYEFCKQNGITFTAYGPLGSPHRMTIKPDDPILLEEPKLKEISKSPSKTPAQILNRFLIERGRITIPKSIHRDRIKENFEILDFQLTAKELRQLDALDKNLRYFGFEYVKDSKDFPFDDPY